MKRKLVLLTIILLASLSRDLHSQDSEMSQLNPFNLTLSIGHGGVHHVFLPALEMRIWQITARGNRGIAYVNAGLDFEIAMLNSRLLQDKLFIPHSSLIVSGIVNWQTDNLPFTEFNRTYKDHYQLLAGVKNYTSPRTVIALKGGVRYTQSTTYEGFYPGPTNISTRTEWHPYFEVSYAISLLRNN